MQMIKRPPDFPPGVEGIGGEQAQKDRKGNWKNNKGQGQNRHHKNTKEKRLWKKNLERTGEVSMCSCERSCHMVMKRKKLETMDGRESG